MATTTVLCTVGAPHEPGVIELLAPARMVFITRATNLASGLALAPGRKVLATLVGDKDDDGRELVHSVRSVGPTETEVNQLIEHNRVMAELALPTPSRGDERNWLTKKYEELLTLGHSAEDIALHGLVDAWQQYDLRFPRTTWLEDLTPGIDEMSEHLRRHGLPYEIDATPLNVTFDANIEEGQDEETARRESIRQLTRIANERAAAASKPERFFSFADLTWDEDPLWLWLTQKQANALLSLGLLKPPVSG